MPAALQLHEFDHPRHDAPDVPDDVLAAVASAAGQTGLFAGERGDRAVDRAWFEIYRAERVSLTSILFSGGDWRWRFHAGRGGAIVSGEGYRSRAECARAVEALRAGAAGAEVRGGVARG